jgi:hypothetical protein
MAELPGWDRERLATARPADVAAARVIVYARRVQPLLAVDVPSRIRDIERMDRPASRATARAERARDVERLRELERTQVELRKVLDLDAEDDA